MTTETTTSTTVELLANVTNWVEDAQVFVQGSTEDTIDLGVSGGGTDVPLHRYREGNHIPISGSQWAILEIFPTRGGYEIVPGSARRRVVARIRKIENPGLAQGDTL